MSVSPPPRRIPFFGLATRRECLVPTWRGWLLLFGTAIAAFGTFVFGVYPFLAINDPIPGGVLVVEGWGSEDTMADVIDELHSNHYDGLFVTGGPIEVTSPLAQFRTFAQYGEAVLEKMGCDPEFVHAVPGSMVRQDRTFASAVALRKWFHKHEWKVEKINVVTMGAHARRTRLLFQAAFRDEAKIGIISSGDRNFDPSHWWGTSQGFRSVTAEAIAYLYARLVFRPPTAPAENLMQ